MFGGQDNPAAMPQSNGQDDTLQGVNDLAGGAAQPPANTDDGTQGGMFIPQSSDSSAASAPDLPEPAQNDGSAAAPVDTNNLLSLKQQALQELTPLVDHLEQTPLEKFRTTMMLIQASDNQALLKDAYEAAQKIEDDKIRAQALLDVINEINYFTQPKQQQD